MKLSWKNWLALAETSVLCCYFFVGMEWLFFTTKPSFMSSVSAFDRVSSLFASPLFPAGAALLIIAGFTAVSSFLSILPYVRTVCGVLYTIAQLLPALILTSSFFLLIDNFTYTVFRFGVINATGNSRYWYALLFLFLLSAAFYWFQQRTLKEPSRTKSKYRHNTCIGLLVCSLVVGGMRLLWQDLPTQITAPESAQVLERPNILVLSSDGIEADHMSAFGYERDTTPFIKKLLPQALVAENNFANAPGTRPSISSILTGRLPYTNRVFALPDQLQGEKAYKHLPGILRSLGYRSYATLFNYTGNPWRFNLRDSFDVVDGKELKWRTGGGIIRGVLDRFPTEERLLWEIWNRLVKRLLHSFVVKDMIDEFTELTQIRGRGGSDRKRLDLLFEQIENSPEPFFAFTHLMGTHGAKYPVTKQVFSRGQQQTHNYMVDFYDDAILRFDGIVEKVVERLRRLDKLDRTVLVIQTDHGTQKDHWRTHTRLPLIILFPGQHPRGRIKKNSQYIDLSPTLLDYLGVDPPAWMEGESLLSDSLDPLRKLVSVYGHNQDKEWANSSHTERLYNISVVICQRVYSFQFPGLRVTHKSVPNHSGPCPFENFPRGEEVIDSVLTDLEERGYDLLSLPKYGKRFLHRKPIVGVDPRPSPGPRLKLDILSAEGLTVTIDGQVELPGDELQRINWRWGDGTKSTSAFPATHTYEKAKTYTINVNAQGKKTRAASIIRVKLPF